MLLKKQLFINCCSTYNTILSAFIKKNIIINSQNNNYYIYNIVVIINSYDNNIYIYIYNIVNTNINIFYSEYLTINMQFNDIAKYFKIIN